VHEASGAWGQRCVGPTKRLQTEREELWRVWANSDACGSAVARVGEL